MRNILTALGIVALSLIMLSFVFKSVKADEKTTAIIGHVITQKIQSNDMDHAEVFGNELNALMHQLTIDLTTVLLQNMPNILDSISAQLRLELDKQYKCSLQSDDYKNKECL
tara:strand:+ start:227 stop:562 length:336 start_codon:yes stop_codon:yes gene_type:complete